MNVKETDLLFLKERSKYFAKNGVSRVKNKDKRRKHRKEKCYVKYFSALRMLKTYNRANSKKIQYPIKALRVNG